MLKDSKSNKNDEEKIRSLQYEIKQLNYENGRLNQENIKKKKIYRKLNQLQHQRERRTQWNDFVDVSKKSAQATKRKKLLLLNNYQLQNSGSRNNPVVINNIFTPIYIDEPEKVEEIS